MAAKKERNKRLKKIAERDAREMIMSYDELWYDRRKVYALRAQTFRNLQFDGDAKEIYMAAFNVALDDSVLPHLQLPEDGSPPKGPLTMEPLVIYSDLYSDLF